MKNSRSKVTNKKKDNARTTIYCPNCGSMHIDQGWHAINPHRWHLCFKCRKKFRMAKPTIGIAK